MSRLFVVNVLRRVLSQKHGLELEVGERTLSEVGYGKLQAAAPPGDFELIAFHGGDQSRPRRVPTLEEVTRAGYQPKIANGIRAGELAIVAALARGATEEEAFKAGDAATQAHRDAVDAEEAAVAAEKPAASEMPELDADTHQLVRDPATSEKSSEQPQSAPDAQGGGAATPAPPPAASSNESAPAADAKPAA